MVSTLGWIVIGIVGVVFAAALAWVGMIWASTRTSRALSQVFKPRATTEELEEIRRELAEL
ncbi:MAG: hypothetical protein U9M97_01330 [Candidatus Hadarchaeota archaeon]|nr:hypothetical protein [Candidatus Hadarchaeota archaeon]